MATRVGAFEAALGHFRLDQSPRPFVWQRDVIGFYDDHFLVYSVAAIAYMPLTFLAARIMRDRKPAPVPRWVMFVWNGFWSIFSAFCFYDLARLMLASTLGWHQSICTDDDMDGGGQLAQSAMRARFLFIIAKLPELGDTALIVLKKRPLILLHYWHHETVMLFCWQIAYLKPEGGDGTYFALMNAFVHWIMYGYYSLSVMFTGLRRVPFLPLTITLLQITQMLLGMVLLGYRTARCNSQKTQNLAFGWLIYASYFVLFVHYFAGRYLGKAVGEKKAK